MSDDFPTSSAAWEGRWIANVGPGTFSQDVVVWTASQGQCEALNHMMKEAATPRKQVFHLAFVPTVETTFHRFP